MNMYKCGFKLDGVDHVLVLVNQNENEKKVKKESVDQIHHIKILDESGSMWGSFQALKEDVVKSLEVIGDKDLVTVIVFSSPGQFRTVVKGMSKSEGLTNILKKLDYRGGCTCFSDPIREASVVVKELRDVCPNFNITLFTDGQPCVTWSIEEELKRIESVLVEMQPNIMAFNTIGYGYGCDEKLLQFMTTFSEFGQFVHSDNIRDYAEIFGKNFERISECVTEKVQIQTKTPIVYLNRKMTKMFQAPKINFNRLDREKNQFFMVNEGEFEFTYNGEKVRTKDITAVIPDATFENFLYAYAYNLFLIGKRSDASVIYGKLLKDKEAVDITQACFTVSEIEAVRQRLEKMVVVNKERYYSGVCPNNYIPRKDAHCVLDILNELATSGCYYVPFHKEADEYERITRKVEDNTNTFERLKDMSYTLIDDFVYHKSKLNMSVKYELHGFVKIDKGDNLNMDKVPVISFKNHTIIKDGNLHMKSMVLLLPDEVHESLKEKKTDIEVLKCEKKVLNALKAEHGMPYVLAKLSFGNKPLINRLYLDKSLSPSTIMDVSFDMEKLEARQAILNYHINLVMAANPIAEKEGLFKRLTKDQIELLKNKYGVNSKGWYYPKDTFKKKVEDSDSYKVKEMEFVWAGLSKLPSVDDFLTRDKNKKPTIGITLLEVAYNWLNQEAKDAGYKLTDTNFAFRDFLKDKLRGVKGELSILRKDMACIKLAKFLNHDDFIGLESDDKGNRFYKAPDDKIMYVKTKEGWEYI